MLKHGQLRVASAFVEVPHKLHGAVGEGKLLAIGRAVEVVGQHQQAHAQRLRQLLLHLGQKLVGNPVAAIERAVDAAARIDQPLAAAVVQGGLAQGGVAGVQLGRRYGTQPAAGYLVEVSSVGDLHGSSRVVIAEHRRSVRRQQ